MNSLPFQILLLKSLILFVYNSIVKVNWLSTLCHNLAFCCGHCVLCLYFLFLITMLAILWQTQTINTVSISITCLLLAIFVKLFHKWAVLIEENGGNIRCINFFRIFEVLNNLLLFIDFFILFSDSTA